MMKFNRRSLYSMLLILCFAHGTQAGIVDLELTSVHYIPDHIQFGYSGDFSVTVTNNGPDDAGVNSPSQRPVIISTSVIQTSELGFPEVSFTSTSSNSDCFFIASIGSPLPGQDPIFNYEFYLPIIPAGDSITCHGRYHVGFDRGEVTVNWSVYNFSDQDPVTSNNGIDMVFNIMPRKVPTLNQWGLLLLLLSVLGMAGLRLRE